MSNVLRFILGLKLAAAEQTRAPFISSRAEAHRSWLSTHQ